MNNLPVYRDRFRTLIGAVLLALSTAIPSRAKDSPSTLSMELDSLARVFIAAAGSYKTDLGPSSKARSPDSLLGRPPYSEAMKQVDTIVDTALFLAQGVTRKAEPVRVMLQRLSSRDRSVDVAYAAHWQDEVYDAAQPLKRLLSYLKRRDPGIDEPIGAHPACCPEIQLDSIPALLTFSKIAGAIEDSLRNRMDPGKMAAEIRNDEKTIRRFRLKLIDGFPSYPWEYLFNLTGNRTQPARWQFIYLHPTFGFGLGGDSVETASDIFRLESWQPAIQLELVGLNCYFFNRWFNYFGVSAVWWTAMGHGDGGYGFNAHFANWMTLGTSLVATTGDWEPRLMVGWTTASSRLLEAFK